MNDILFTSTQEARTWSDSLEQGGKYYQNLVSELENAKNEIALNWEGDTSDISDIISRIDTVIATFSNKITPALLQLSNGITSFATAVDQVAKADVENGPATEISVDSTSTGAAGTDKSDKKSEPGFWAYHGQDFANDWDYSGCDSGLDYAGATISGLCGTVGSAVNFVIGAISEGLGALFG